MLAAPGRSARVREMAGNEREPDSGMLRILPGVLSSGRTRRCPPGQTHERSSIAMPGRLEHRTLAEFLPICMYCKNIRDQDGHWDTLEHYVSAHAGSQFTHGLCETCLARFLQEYGLTDG